jgi:hypothetical protein
MTTCGEGWYDKRPLQCSTPYEAQAKRRKVG